VLCLFISPGSAQTLLRQDGKINCHLIAKSLVNVYAKNVKIGYCLLNNNNNNDRLTAFDPGQPG